MEKEEKVNIEIGYKDKEPDLSKLKFEGYKVEGNKTIKLTLGEVKIKKVEEI